MNSLAVQCCGKKYIYGYKNTIYQELYFAIPLVIDICDYTVAIDIPDEESYWIIMLFAFCRSYISLDYFLKKSNAV
jgi:hypothetical protein